MLHSALAYLIDMPDSTVCLTPPLRVLKLGGARGEDRNVNFLVFNAGASMPTCVLRISRTPSGEQRLQHAYAKLCQVAAIPTMTSLVPQPIGLFELGGRLVMAETCVDGIPLDILLKRRKRVQPRQVEADLNTAGELLQTLQRGTCSGAHIFEGSAAVIGRIQQYAGTLSFPDIFVADLCRTADTYQGLEIPLVGCHGDFWAGNLMMDGSVARLIDWEDYCDGEPPFSDIFLFAVTYAFAYPWTQWRQQDKATAFRKGFLETSRISEYLRAFVYNCFSALGIPTQAAHVMFSLFLLDMALPGAAHSQGRTGQHERWQTMIQGYAQNARFSVFAEA